MVDVHQEESGGKAFKTVFDLLTSDLHTCCPGIIVDFNKNERTCSVQPSLKRLFTGDEEATLLPIQKDVPVAYPGSGNFFLEYELEPDDEVLCVISERAIDQWLTLGGTVDPESKRRFALSDMIVVAGLKSTLNIQAPVGTGIALRNRTSQIEVRIIDDLITAKVNTTVMEVSVDGVKVKPTLPVATDVKAYQPVPPLPTEVAAPGVAPGYVTLANHCHYFIPPTTGTPLPTSGAVLAAGDVGPP